MRKAFVPLVAVVGAMFVVAPFLVARAPYESTMGLIQKIFYYHVPAWMAMYSAIAVCSVASAIYLFQSKPAADRYAVSSAEIAVLFGLMGLVTGPLWGRKAWGVWWQWDARLTSALLLELIMIAYLLARRYGGPAGRKLSAALGLFAALDVPLVYKSVDIWRTVHPQTTVVPSLDPRMRPAFWTAFALILLVWAMLFMVRLRLERARAELASLRLDVEDMLEIG